MMTPADNRRLGLHPSYWTTLNCGRGAKSTQHAKKNGCVQAIPRSHCPDVINVQADADLARTGRAALPTGE
jgi:hypothetical protein